LASIASVAQVSLTTRARDEEVGATIQIVDGHEAPARAGGMPPGTIVAVEHLFNNVPARLKFLKQPATEAAHIQQIVTRYAVAYPGRRLSLVSDGNRSSSPRGAESSRMCCSRSTAGNSPTDVAVSGIGRRGGRARR